MITRGFKDSVDLEFRRLKDRVEFLEESRLHWIKVADARQKDFVLLLSHLGLEFKNSTREIVAVEKFDKFKQ